MAAIIREESVFCEVTPRSRQGHTPKLTHFSVGIFALLPRFFRTLLLQVISPPRCRQVVEVVIPVNGPIDFAVQMLNYLKLIQRYRIRLDQR